MSDDEVKPKSFPSNLLSKDWSKRICIEYEVGNKVAQDITDGVHDMEVREDDVWIVTVPKSGTTWMQELVWLVMNDFNFDHAKKEPLELRSPFVEMKIMTESTIKKTLEVLQNYKSPRILKSHRPLPLLPQQLWTKKPKVIYVSRDPRDVFVSQYHFVQNFGRYINVPIEEYLREELENEKKKCLWFNHVLEFYELRHSPWIYYTSYENMKKNLRQEILSVCQFLKKSINDEQMEKMLKHLSFEEMQKNPQVNHVWETQKIRETFNILNYQENKFFRKGTIGSHMEEISQELQNELNNWMEDHLQSHNLTLDDVLVKYQI